jgi:dolichol-phosphate mannosyltransferase
VALGAGGEHTFLGNGHQNGNGHATDRVHRLTHWRLRRTEATPTEHVSIPTRRNYCYDVHGIVGVASDADLPELAAFRVPSLDSEPDIDVRIGPLERHPGVPRLCDELDATMRYSEMGNAGFAADIAVNERVYVRAAPLLARSPHVLYTNLVEPILRWRFVRLGFALVHGACLVQDDAAFIITARTDTGKTTTILKLLEAMPECEFLSDDLTLVSPDGMMHAYPKPLTISQHTVRAVKRHRLTWRERATLPIQSRLHSRSGRRIAFLLSSLRLPAATLNTVVQALIPPPKYPVQRLVPGVRIAKPAPLRGVIVIHRNADAFEWLDEKDATDIVLANTEDAYGFPPYHAIEDFLLRAFPGKLRASERRTLVGALEDVPAAMLGSTTYSWAADIPGLLSTMRRRAPVVPPRSDAYVLESVAPSMNALEVD